MFCNIYMAFGTGFGNLLITLTEQAFSCYLISVHNKWILTIPTFLKPLKSSLWWSLSEMAKQAGSQKSSFSIQNETFYITSQPHIYWHDYYIYIGQESNLIKLYGYTEIISTILLVFGYSKEKTNFTSNPCTKKLDIDTHVFAMRSHLSTVNWPNNQESDVYYNKRVCYLPAIRLLLQQVHSTGKEGVAWYRAPFCRINTRNSCYTWVSIVR